MRSFMMSRLTCSAAAVTAAFAVANETGFAIAATAGQTAVHTPMTDNGHAIASNQAVHSVANETCSDSNPSASAAARVMVASAAACFGVENKIGDGDNNVAGNVNGGKMQAMIGDNDRNVGNQLAS